MRRLAIALCLLVLRAAAVAQTNTPTATPSFTPDLGFVVHAENPTPPGATATATWTSTPSRTFTQTPTLTATPTLTGTPTRTATFTVTPTRTNTPDLSFVVHAPAAATATVPTATFTALPTLTPTRTPTITNTPTRTPTPAPTVTGTVPDTETPTETPTDTETPTETPTVTGTPPSPTFTPDLSFVVNAADQPTPLASATATGTRTATPAPTATNTGAAGTPTWTPNFSFVVNAAEVPHATPSSSPTAATFTPTITGTATPATPLPTSTPPATNSPTRTRTITATPAGTPTPGGLPCLEGAACSPLGTLTDNLGLCKPASGEAHWDSYFALDLDRLDRLFPNCTLYPQNGGTGTGIEPGEGDLLVGNGASGHYVPLARGQDGQVLAVRDGTLTWTYPCTANAGAPDPADCAADAQAGRCVVDTVNKRLYICAGQVRGWDYVPLT